MKTNPVKLSSPYIPCSIDYFVVAGKSIKRKQWLAKYELYEAETNLGKRIVTPVTIVGQPKDQIFMMDAITGSLYDKLTGRCLTSSMIRMTKVIPKKGLADKLFKMKADDS